MIEYNVCKYLIEKSGTKHPAEISAFIQLYADYFRMIARQNSYRVDRNFVAEVPPELEDFVNANKN